MQGVYYGDCRALGPWTLGLLPVIHRRVVVAFSGLGGLGRHPGRWPLGGGRRPCLITRRDKGGRRFGLGFGHSGRGSNFGRGFSGRGGGCHVAPVAPAVVAARDACVARQGGLPRGTVVVLSVAVGRVLVGAAAARAPVVVVAVAVAVALASVVATAAPAV